jgi:AraC-like DNA-binding protein
MRVLRSIFLFEKKHSWKADQVGVEPRIAAVAASGVLGLIGQVGGDPDRIFGVARVDMGDAANPAASLNLRRYCDLFEQAARLTGVENFGLRFGTGYRLEEMGALGALVLHSRTLGEALKNLCAYFPAVQEHSTLALRGDGELMALEYQIRDGRIARRRQDAELTIGILNGIFLRCLGANWSPEEVHFEHLRGADAAEIRGLLGAPVYFAAARNAILFRRAVLPARMPDAAPIRLPALHALLRRRAVEARPDDFIGQVVEQIRAGFGRGDAGITQVAARLGHSRAGLYRRLAAEGLDFSRLTQSVRRDLAVMYVAQPGVMFTDIALMLGYSELSAFSRAFTRWTGCSPACYRMERVLPCT